MGGFFGVVSTEECIADLFYGTDYHSHLGTKRGGMAVASGNGTILRKIHDISNTQFRSKFDSDLENFSGNAGIGVISDFDDQPLVITSQHGTYAIVTVGRINNLQDLARELFESGLSHFSESGKGGINPTEMVAALINRRPSIVDGIEYAQSRIDGSCSILILCSDCIYAARDRYGRTPVAVGEKDGAMSVAMETTAFPNLDYTFKYELGSGEIVQIYPDRLIQKKAPGDITQICAFLWVYYGYPSSRYHGVNTETVRYRNGEFLAADEPLKDIDTICGIPDSGVAHAIGFSNAAHKPYQRSFVKYTPTWARSFMPQNQKMRSLVAKMKLIPIDEQIAGKKLLFCDDSIVRGTQLKDTVGRIYERGAKEVHMRSASPPLVYGCKFLNFSTSRSELDLAARRAIAKLEGKEPDDALVAEYTVYGSEKYNKMVEIIRQELNLTSLRFQKLERLIEAIGLPREQICTFCWTGREPEKDKDI